MLRCANTAEASLRRPGTRDSAQPCGQWAWAWNAAPWREPGRHTVASSDPPPTAARLAEPRAPLDGRASHCLDPAASASKRPGPAPGACCAQRAWDDYRLRVPPAEYRRAHSVTPRRCAWRRPRRREGKEAGRSRDRGWGEGGQEGARSLGRVGPLGVRGAPAARGACVWCVRACGKDRLPSCSLRQLHGNSTAYREARTNGAQAPRATCSPTSHVPCHTGVMIHR
jgi:hypothetical protein